MSEDNQELSATPSASPGADEEKGGSKKMIMMLVVLLFILGGAGAGLYFSGFLDSMMNKEEAPVEEAVTPAVTATGGAATSATAQFLKLPDITVNLNSEDGRPRYLRLSVQLEFKNAQDMAAAEALLPRIVDQFQTYLRELRVRDLRGSAGIYRLQIELLARVNQAAYPVEVQDVLFQEILIQ